MTVTLDTASSFPSGGLAGLRVLIVDDDVDWTEALEALLLSRGCSVATAPDEATALSAIARERPRVVLLDIGLADASGPDVAVRLRAATAPESPVLIALSGFDEADKGPASREAGCAHYLMKPVDVAALMALLEDAAHA